MSRLAIAIASAATAVLAVLPAGSSAAAKHKPRNCAPPEAAILLANPHAEVFQYRFGVYTCLRHTGSIGYLGHTEQPPAWDCVEGEERCGAVSLEALAGTVVAYIESRFEPGGRAPERIIARSIPTGQVLHSGWLSVAVVQRTMLEEARAVRVTVKANGTVAWIQQDGYGRHGGGTPPPTVYDVFAVDTHGFHSLRTELPSKPYSLYFRHGMLTWKQAGTPQSAPLE